MQGWLGKAATWKQSLPAQLIKPVSPEVMSGAHKALWKDDILAQHHNTVMCLSHSTLQMLLCDDYYKGVGFLLPVLSVPIYKVKPLLSCTWFVARLAKQGQVGLVLAWEISKEHPGAAGSVEGDSVGGVLPFG